MFLSHSPACHWYCMVLPWGNHWSHWIEPLCKRHLAPSSKRQMTPWPIESMVRMLARSTKELPNCATLAKTPAVSQHAETMGTPWQGGLAWNFRQLNSEPEPETSSSTAETRTPSTTTIRKSMPFAEGSEEITTSEIGASTLISSQNEEMDRELGPGPGPVWPGDLKVSFLVRRCPWLVPRINKVFTS